MTDYAQVLALALMPFVGNACGAVIAWRVPVSPRLVGALLHAAAGIAVAVVSVELVPRVLQDIRPWQLGVAFGGGAAFSVVLARAVGWATQTTRSGAGRAWMVYLAIAADLFGDGLMVGIGATIAADLGLLLGMGQVVANVPGGFAVAANFRRRAVSRTARLSAVAGLGAAVFVGATAGYWWLGGADTAAQNTALTFVIGVLLLTTIEDLVPEADAPAAARWLTTIAFSASFLFFALLALSFRP